jgi:hypothetical protein
MFPHLLLLFQALFIFHVASPLYLMVFHRRSPTAALDYLSEAEEYGVAEMSLLDVLWEAL